MSIKAVSENIDGTQNHIKLSRNPFKKFSMGRQEMMHDLTTVRILRLSIGATIAMALAYALDWPLAMLTPVFTVVFLSLPFPRPTLYLGFRNMLQTLLAVAIGVLFTLYLLPMPFVFSLMFGLALFHTYYTHFRTAALVVIPTKVRKNVKNQKGEARAILQVSLRACLGFQPGHEQSISQHHDHRSNKQTNNS